jgi:arsenate reductase-like glutaredoxin family protein
MKKIMMVGLLLTMIVAVQAQVKVAPKMAKGMQKVYVTESKVGIPGQPEFNMTAETKYSVTGAVKGGYTMEVVTTEFKCDAADTNIAAKLMSAPLELLKGLTVRVTTDQDGQVKSIDNFAELKKKMDEMGGQLVNELFEKVSMLSQVMDKETLKKQVLSSVTPESMLKSMQVTNSPLMLNGKTVTMGMQEDYTADYGLRMKRMYFVNGNKITTNGSLNMSKDDMKQLIIKEVEKIMPSQADMVKENIDQLMDSGMAKIDSKETATYELQDDGWVKNILAEATYQMMGQNTKTVIRVEIKD